MNESKKGASPVLTLHHRIASLKAKYEDYYPHAKAPLEEPLSIIAELMRRINVAKYLMMCVEPHDDYTHTLAFAIEICDLNKEPKEWPI